MLGSAVNRPTTEKASMYSNSMGSPEKLFIYLYFGTLCYTHTHFLGSPLIVTSSFVFCIFYVLVCSPISLAVSHFGAHWVPHSIDCVASFVYNHHRQPQPLWCSAQWAPLHWLCTKLCVEALVLVSDTLVLMEQDKHCLTLQTSPFGSSPSWWSWASLDIFRHLLSISQTLLFTLNMLMFSNITIWL